MALIITPSMTRSEMNQVDTGVNSLVRDVIDNTKVNPPDDFRRGLTEFALEWRTFRDANQDAFSQGLSGVYGQVQDFKRRLEDWKKKYAGLGGSITAPQLKLQQSMFEGPGGIFGKAADSIKWVGLGLVVVGGVAGLMYITRK